MFDAIPEMSPAEYEVLQELLNPTQKCTTTLGIFIKIQLNTITLHHLKISILLLKKEEDTMLSLVKLAVCWG